MDGSRFWLSVATALVCAAILSCRQSGDGRTPTSSANALMSTPLATPAAESSRIFSTLPAADTGLDFTNKADSRAIRVSLRNFWGGVASGDYDGDGDLDLYLCNVEESNRLYRNDGDWKFSDVTAESGEALGCGELWSAGAYFVDLDADQDQDLYVCNMNGPNAVFINDGAGHFSDQAATMGLNSEYFSICAAFLDADLDGDLDIYQGNYLYDRFADAVPEAYKRNKELQFDEQGIVTAPAELAGKVYKFENGVIYPRPDPAQLFINDGKGHFSDKAKEAGILRYGWTLGALTTDFNNDALPDLYISGDYETPDYYFLNNGDGTFTDKAREMLRRTSFFSMGSDAGDINNDGEVDFFVGDMLPGNYKDARKQSGDMYTFRWELINLHPQQNMRNTLFVNRGGGWMSELAEGANLQASEWTWSVRLADLDCSGLPEVFCTNGYINKGIEVDVDNLVTRMRKEGRPREEIDELILSLPPYLTDDRIFTASTALNYSAAPDNWGIHDNAIGCGASVADYDGDGDQDIIVNTTNGPVAVYRNDVAVDNRAVLRLRDPGSKLNPQAVGARVWAHFDGQVQVHDVIIARGFASGEGGEIYLGLGQAEQVDKLEIRWPDGSFQVHEKLQAGNLHEISKARGLPLWQPSRPAALFEQRPLDWQQKEAFTLEAEFEAEPLLPVMQSTLGTGAAVADADGNGTLDVYLCGPAGQSGQLLLGDGRGGFKPSNALNGMLPAEAEEMSALWFEANGDGRPDLLITSGGMEAELGSAVYQSKVLLNGESGFSAASVPARTVSTGSACAADIDSDGDLDLFLAGHIRRYAYAMNVPSAFWLNDGQGNFSDATAQLGSEVGRQGQISEAQFADIDGNGSPDLLLAVRWGRIEYWPNEGGVFKTRLELSQHSGWWQSLGVGDFDNDGDLDIAAGNTGTNVKYHPKPDENKPVTLFANDFDGSGTRDLIEVKYRNDGCMLPGRGRSCSGYAIKYIPQKFSSWASFADATLEDVYGEGLKTAERYDAGDLHSLLLRNDGGSFSEMPLPEEAQWAPAFGLGIADFNADGKLDISMAGNFYATQPETGRWNAGYGVLLLGKGDCNFEALSPAESGISMPWDTRSAIPADLNSDGRSDLLVSTSVGQPQICLAQGSGQPGSLMLRLRGKGANSQAVGTRVSIELEDGTSLLREVQAGSGYLGSYSGPLLVDLPSGARARGIKVRWPDGSESEAKAEKQMLELSQP
ncbi:VCBS repeat-containing protein [bacterium]|nr:VCBS repeat-containing protein [bacterium]